MISTSNHVFYLTKSERKSEMLNSWVLKLKTSQKNITLLSAVLSSVIVSGACRHAHNTPHLYDDTTSAPSLRPGAACCTAPREYYIYYIFRLKDMACRSTVVLTVIVVLVLPSVRCYSSGQVTPSCDSMVPVHGGASPQTSPPPFRITSNKNTYQDGDQVTGKER